MTASKMVMPNTWADFVFGFGFEFVFARLPLFFATFCDGPIVAADTASDTNSTSDDDEDDDSDVGGVSGVICGFTSVWKLHENGKKDKQMRRSKR